VGIVKFIFLTDPMGFVVSSSGEGIKKAVYRWVLAVGGVVGGVGSLVVGVGNIEVYFVWNWVVVGEGMWEADGGGGGITGGSVFCEDGCGWECSSGGGCRRVS
jgi:hypothetical protein